jgi:hypothetical protein
MQHWETLAEYDRDGFRVIVDKTWEDTHPRDLFEAEDVEEICRKIDQGLYDWFQLRVRVMLDGIELGSAYLGGCCYDDARSVLTDGVAEDMIWDAQHEAKKRLTELAQKFTMMVIKNA